MNIRISVDGYGETHDANRKTAEGRGSWPLVAKNLPVYRELMEKYRVKTRIVTTLNRAGSSKLYDNYTKVYEIAGMPMGFLFVHEEDWTPEDFEKIKEQVSRLHDYQTKNSMRFKISNIRTRVRGNNNALVSHSICSAGISSFTVDCQGDIYPCHRCYYNDAGSFYKMGSVDTGISYARRAFIHEINNLDMLPTKCQKCNPVIRERCHVCFSTNKKVYDNPHHLPNKYCLLMKELYYLLLEKENRIKNHNINTRVPLNVAN